MKLSYAVYVGDRESDYVPEMLIRKTGLSRREAAREAEHALRDWPQVTICEEPQP